MKIIQTISYYPPHLGGMENTARRLSFALSNSGYEVEVYTSNIGCGKEKIKSNKNLKINYLPAIEIAHTPIIPSIFFKLLMIKKDSIIHIHAAQSFLPEIVYLIKKIKSIPYVVHLHGNVESTGKLGFLLPFYKKIVFKRFLRNADTVIVLTEGYKKYFKKKYNLSNNIEVVPNGIESSFFIKDKKKDSKITNLIYVGRLSKEKRVNELIEAISLLKNKVIFNIVGEGEERENLQNLIKKNDLKNIVMHGRKEGNDLLNFYRKSDILLLASDSEGIPTSVLEAMASKTAVIATNVRGTKELVNGIGVLINPPLAKNFAAEIDKLIENKKRRSILIEKGLKKAKEFKSQQIIDKINKIYNKIENQYENK